MARTSRPPDWQLPPGVTPGLWDYLHHPGIALEYLDKVASSPFARADQRFVLEKLPNPCRVIDLGCGPGRSLIPLAQRGFSCVGVDLSANMLAEATSRLGGCQPPVTLVQVNLAEPLPFAANSFDAALCLFGTLGMLHPVEARQQFLSEVKRILKSKATFLLHVHNLNWLDHFKKKTTKNCQEPGIITMPLHLGVANLQMKLYSLPEILAVTKRVGFTEQDCWYLSPGAANGLLPVSSWFQSRRAAGFLLALKKIA
jgi:SAM-dependent methyltransferase